MPSDSPVPEAPAAVSQLVPLSALYESPMNPRKYFDRKRLEDLAASIKEHGVLEPLIVRANGEPSKAEIICGARRFRAAKLAGLSEVPVVFHQFSDEEVKIVQLVENGQREDLSPLEEAETYMGLAESGMSVSVIAKSLGRETREVARRLPLAKLPKRVKDALGSGLLPAEYAELIARIPDAKLQEAALGRVLEDYASDEKPVLHVVPFAVAKRIVEAEFMTALSAAIFDPEDPALSPLGPCSTCPHLAGNNPDLFGDVKGKAVCTNPADFHLKTTNHLKRLRESGRTVLVTPKELKRAFPFGESDQPGREFVDLERTCPDDPKHRRYEELLGRAEKLKTVFALKNGRVRQLYPAKDIKAALVAAGHAFANEKRRRTVTNAEASRSAARLERIGEEAVSRELAVRLRSVKLSPSGWIDLVLQIVLIDAHWKVEGVIRRYGFEGTKEEFAQKRDEILKSRLEAMTEAEKRAFLVDLLIGDWISTPHKPQREFYKHVLRLAGVDYVKTANRAIDEAKREAVAAKDVPPPPIAAKTVGSKKSAKERR